MLDDIPRSDKLTDLFGNRVYPTNRTADSEIELDGYGYRWFRIDSG
jgi:maltose alpha-D-glucosyltransferase/alpha-amylase